MYLSLQKSVSQITKTQTPNLNYDIIFEESN